MYSINLRPSGYILKFSGQVDLEEMQEWYDESAELLKKAPESFGVIVDMTQLLPLTPDTQALMIKGQGLYKAKGMKRSAVILQNPILKLQFTRLAKDSGIYETERYFDGSKSGAIENAIEWVKNEKYIEDTKEEEISR